MKVIHPTRRQAAGIAQAMHAVVTAEGRFAALPLEIKTLDAIQWHLLHQHEPLAVDDCVLPADLPNVLHTGDLRRETVRILALLPVVDQAVRAEKADVVERAAAALGIEDHGLTILRQAVRRQHRRIALAAMTRAVAHYWSPTGKARVRDWVDMVRIMLPPTPGLYAILTNQKLLEKYKALSAKPESTLGRILYTFYAQRGFPLPGEPKSFPEGWGKHEVYHVLSEYDTTFQGEMLNAAFSGGNTEKLCMDLLLITLLQFHAGRQIMPGPALSGQLEPDLFFRAVARGAAMNIDLLNDFDIWRLVDEPLQQLRETLEIPALSLAERNALISAEALLA
jgi:hypothetical protein